MRLWVLVVDTYEHDGGNKFPIVTHQFRGKTKSEALGYYQAHLKTDEFLRGCVEKRRWRSVNCNADAYWTQD